MSNELLYLGIGAAAVYLFARAKKSAPAIASTAKKPSVIPGVTPGTTPGIAPQPYDDSWFTQPQGIDASGNIVFGDDVKNITPEQWIFAIKDESQASAISMQEAFNRIYAAAVTDLDKGAILEAGMRLNLKSPASTVVAKTGIGMAATIALLATGYYFIVNR